MLSETSPSPNFAIKKVWFLGMSSGKLLYGAID